MPTMKAIIRQAMSELGSRKSKRKAAAARRNGKKGGRPRKNANAGMGKTS